MDKDFARAGGAVVGAAISLPLLVALIKASIFFGEMKAAVTELRAAVTAAGTTMSKLGAEMQGWREDHETRISVLEAHEKWDGQNERRLGERRSP